MTTVITFPRIICCFNSGRKITTLRWKNNRACYEYLFFPCIFARF
ncbi:hypothetical protein TFKS16_1770 [Tannerella forsythia KS16]|nr:hypothetical protein TF3313_1823 [Tannerella forsythia 3313]BAR51998.1 hypothetical protein TFKS16_1770 [Tannerella forsythia KS16]